MSASETLQVAVAAALKSRTEIAVYDGPPLQAAMPYAVVECGPESDWGHKGGRGRELRVAVTVRAAGERPAALYGAMNALEGALETPVAVAGWDVAGFVWIRSRSAREGRAPAAVTWIGALEYRARLLEAAAQA